MYIYIASKHPEERLWTVGFYKPDGTWEPESDWTEAEDAAVRVNYLNGGTGQATDRSVHAPRNG